MIKAMPVRHVILGLISCIFISNAVFFFTHYEFFNLLTMWVCVSSFINISLLPNRFYEVDNWHFKSFYAPWFVLRDYIKYLETREPLISFLPQQDTLTKETSLHDYHSLSLQELKLLHKVRVVQPS